LGLNLNEQLSQNRAQAPLTQSDLTRRNGGPLWVSTEEIAGPIYRALRAAGHTSLPPVSKLVDLSLLHEAYAHKLDA
jgi:hypothetical protein